MDRRVAGNRARGRARSRCAATRGHGLAPALILGETGTGKERVAAEIHQQSARSGPYVKFSCAELSRELAHSQLFGHERGAFTGAAASHRGLFATADRGTLRATSKHSAKIAARSIAGSSCSASSAEARVTRPMGQSHGRPMRAGRARAVPGEKGAFCAVRGPARWVQCGSSTPKAPNLPRAPKPKKVQRHVGTVDVLCRQSAGPHSDQKTAGLPAHPAARALKRLRAARLAQRS
ncbi:MAG: sigma 54-interacting transcriptional regulator [Pseudomonadota bacterium]